MGNLNVQVCSPQPTYVIVERIGIKGGLPSKFAIGPQLRQVQRSVMQVCDVQDIYYRGQRTQGMPSTWQYLEHFFLPGTQLTTRSTGDRQLLLVYAGFRNLVTPLPALGNLLPKSVTTEYDLGVPLSPFIYGTDPIAHQQLFGNASINFVMPGGKGEPTAVAIYNATNGRLEVPPVQLRQKAVKKLLESQR